MAPHHHQVKFLLEKRLLDLANGGLIPQITGIHSIVEEDGLIHVGFDLLDRNEPVFLTSSGPRW